jgi:hypothetical protein
MEEVGPVLPDAEEANERIWEITAEARFSPMAMP